MAGIKDVLEVAIKEMNDHLDQNQFYSWKNERIIAVLKEAIDLAYQAGRSDEKYFTHGPKAVKLYD